MIQKIFPKKKYLTKSPTQTKKIGAILAKRASNTKYRNKQAFVLGLEGDLGGGKTTFLQGFAKGLGIKDKILSPTFVIMKRFEITSLDSPSRRGGRNQPSKESKTAAKFEIFYHIDCYRIKSAKELLDLDFKEIVANPRSIIAIEWADRVSSIMPLHSLILRFRFIDDKSREITLA